MQFRVVNLALLRVKLKRKDFYEEITFRNKAVNKNVKKVIAEWMFCLAKYKEIRVESFRELFSGLRDEIVFPIKIENCYCYRSLDIIIVDSNGKEYYMSKGCIYNYDDMETYYVV